MSLHELIPMAWNDQFEPEFVVPQGLLSLIADRRSRRVDFLIRWSDLTEAGTMFREENSQGLNV